MKFLNIQYDTEIDKLSGSAINNSFLYMNWDSHDHLKFIDIFEIFETAIYSAPVFKDIGTECFVYSLSIKLEL